MKKIFLATVMAFGSFTLAGCNKSEPGGKPEASFTVSPPGTTDLKPGESKPVKLTVNRTDPFKEAVIFTANEVPKGLKMDTKSKTADAGTKEVAFNVTAEENAQPGDYVIKMTAKPEKTGKETITDVKITVNKP